MERSFLESLGLEDGIICQILDENSRDIGREKQSAETLQAEINSLREAVDKQNYDSAVRSAVRERGVQFSSKAAERDFIARLKEKNLEMKEGVLTGLEDFIQAQMTAEPDAFAVERPVPRFVAPAGIGNVSPEPVPANVAQARQMGAERAAAMRSSGEVLKNFL